MQLQPGSTPGPPWGFTQIGGQYYTDFQVVGSPDYMDPNKVPLMSEPPHIAHLGRRLAVVGTTVGFSVLCMDRLGQRQRLFSLGVCM